MRPIHSDTKCLKSEKPSMLVVLFEVFSAASLSSSLLCDPRVTVSVTFVIVSETRISHFLLNIRIRLLQDTD